MTVCGCCKKAIVIDVPSFRVEGGAWLGRLRIVDRHGHVVHDCGSR